MSRHALPPKWDGNPVIWDKWMPIDCLIFGGGVSLQRGARRYA